MTNIISDVRVETIGFALLSVLLVVPSVALAARIRTVLVLPRILLFGILIVVLGLSAELIFFVTMFNTRCAILLTWAGAVYGAYHTVRALTEAQFRRTLRFSDSWAPFVVTAAGALGYLALLCVAIPGTGSIEASIDAWMGMPLDNSLPHILASHIAAHLPPKPFVAEWLSSDRPPLQAGFDLLFASFTPFAKDSEPRYEALSVLLQASSIGLLYTLARLCGCRPLRSAAIVLFAWFSGFFLLNTLFVWPKLIAAAYLAVGVSVFLCPGSLNWRRGVVIGISAVLGLLCHSGVVFAVPCLVMAWLVNKRLRSVGALSAAAVAGVALLLPWAWYQNVYDPPGNRLIKWYLAGQIAVTSDSFLHALHHAYADTPPATIAGYKLENFAPPLGINTSRNTWSQPKDREFFYVKDALSALFVPYVAALFLIRSKRRTLQIASRIAWISLGNIVLWCLIIYLPAYTMIHVGSHLTMVLMFLSGAIVATEWIPAFVIIALYQVDDFATAWLPTIGFARLASAGGLYCGIILSFVVAICIALSRRRAAEEVSAWARQLPFGGQGSSNGIRDYARAHLGGIATLLSVTLATVAATAQFQNVVITVPNVRSEGSPKLAQLKIASASLDVIKVAEHQQIVASLTKPTTFDVGPNESIDFVGWAFDPVTSRPAGSVAIRINGHDTGATYGLMRPDVAKAYSNPRLEGVGFSASLNGNKLEPGVNVVSVIVVSSDQTSYYENATYVRLVER